MHKLLCASVSLNQWAWIGTLNYFIFYFFDSFLFPFLFSLLLFMFSFSCFFPPLFSLTFLVSRWDDMVSHLQLANAFVFKHNFLHLKNNFAHYNSENPSNGYLTTRREKTKAQVNKHTTWLSWFWVSLFALW